MNELTIFKNDNFGEIRTITLNGEPWFVLKDVCNILDIKNTTQAAERLDEDERSMFDIGRQGKVNIINESGLYSIVLRSDKSEARKFKRWVTHDVIPQIRKSGMYIRLQKLIPML